MSNKINKVLQPSIVTNMYHRLKYIHWRIYSNWPFKLD